MILSIILGLIVLMLVPSVIIRDSSTTIDRTVFIGPFEFREIRAKNHTREHVQTNLSNWILRFTSKITEYTDKLLESNQCGLVDMRPHCRPIWVNKAINEVEEKINEIRWGVQQSSKK